MCDIRFGISWPEKITRCISHISLQFLLNGVVPVRVKGRRTRQCTDIFRSVGRCAICGFVFLGQKNHKMHIAHLARFGSVGRCAIFGFVFLGPKNHKMHIAHLSSDRVNHNPSKTDVRPPNYHKKNVWTPCHFLATPVGRIMVNHSPSKTDECPPNISNMKVHKGTVTFRKRPLDGLWLIIIRPRQTNVRQIFPKCMCSDLIHFLATIVGRID